MKILRLLILNLLICWEFGSIVFFIMINLMKIFLLKVFFLMVLVFGGGKLLMNLICVWCLI